jgi:hypothetical protein
MRICWPSEPSYSNRILDIHRGKWAGHRFDIVSQEIHETEAGVQGWRDVSAEIVKEAQEFRRKVVQLRPGRKLF